MQYSQSDEEVDDKIVQGVEEVKFTSSTLVNTVPAMEDEDIEPELEPGPPAERRDRTQYMRSNERRHH
jgi:hypothetical protein